MWRKILFALLLVLVATLSAAGGVRNALSPYGSQDLQWQPVGRLLHRENPYTPILDAEPNDNSHTFLSQIPNYPVSGYTFLLPLGLFNWEAARLGWVICNLLFTLLLIAGLQTLFPLSRNKLFVTVCLFLSSSSWRITLGNGQHGLFVLAFFVWAVVWCERDKKRPYLSALFLAISFFKYTITAPLAIYFVWKRQWRPLITAVLIHILITGAMALWLREDFIALIRQPFQVAALFTTIGDYDIFSASRMLGLSEVIPAVLALIILLALTLIPIVRGGAKCISPLRALSTLALTAYLILFHRSYDLILLIFPLWLVMQPLPSRSPSQREGDQKSPPHWRGLRGGWLVLILIILIILAWHGRRISLALLGFVPANTADLLYTILLALLALTHLASLITLLIPNRKKGTI